MALLFLFFVINTLHRTSLDRLFNTIFRSALGHDNFSFFFFFLKRKYFRAKLNTAFAANAFIGVNHDNFSHGRISFR